MAGTSLANFSWLSSLPNLMQQARGMGGGSMTGAGQQGWAPGPGGDIYPMFGGGPDRAVNPNAGTDPSAVMQQPAGADQTTAQTEASLGRNSPLLGGGGAGPMEWNGPVPPPGGAPRPPTTAPMQPPAGLNPGVGLVNGVGGGGNPADWMQALKAYL